MADIIGVEETQPTFDQELEATSSVWPFLWKAAEAGCIEAQRYFADRGLDIEPGLASELQRYEAKRFLQAHGIEAQDDITLDPLTRNGIGFWYLGRHWRMWKRGAGRELVPRAGDSTRKQAFFNHHEEVRNTS